MYARNALRHYIVLLTHFCYFVSAGVVIWELITTLKPWANVTPMQVRMQ